MNNLKLRVYKNYRLAGVMAVFLAGMLVYSCNDVLDGVSSDGFFDFEIAKAYDGQLSQETRERFRISAEKLAARYILEHDSTRYDIPINLIDFYYNGLVHIANSKLKAGKQVSEEYEIVAWKPGDPRILEIRFSNSPGWAEAWKKGQTITGNPDVDELLTRFDLKLHRFTDFYLSSDIYAQFRSEHPYNMEGVGNIFKKNISETKYAGFVATFGSRPEIEAEVTQKYIQYSFYFPFGKNTYSNSSFHYWIFRVYPDGQVELGREWGDPLP